VSFSPEASRRELGAASPDVGVALIGAGTVAHLHAKGIRRCRSARLVGVHDPDRARADTLAGHYGGEALGSLDDLLARDDVQAVCVLTPVDSHVSIAERCLRAGKHVLIEKPVAGSVAEIERLRRAAAAASRLCVPAHNYIHAPAVRRMKRLLDEGAFGKVGSFWMLFNIFHDEPTAAIYGGVLRAVCVHHAYSLLYLLGRPASVQAVASSVHYETLSCEDQVMITATLPGGAIANLWASFVADDRTNDPWSLTYKLIGTRGAANFSWADAGFDDTGGPAWGLANYVDSFAAEIEHFVERCLLGGEPPLSSLADAADALRIIEACERSIAHGVRVEPEWP
jgi:predicted dehydrogenase